MLKIMLIMLIKNSSVLMQFLVDVEDKEIRGSQLMEIVRDG